MLAKVHLVVLEELVAAAVVINRPFLLMLFLASALFNMSCSVDLASSTPGASTGCVPTTAQLNQFSTVMTNVLQSTGPVGSDSVGCAQCHLSGGPGSGSYLVLAGSSNDVLTSNFCAAKSRSSRLATHPTENTHPHVYRTIDLTDLAAWVQSL